MQHLTAVISVDEDKCVNCHACISACPVKYCIDGSGAHVTINHDLCIGCGSCIEACTHDARNIIDDTAAFFEALSRREKIVAVAAPAAASSYPDAYLNLNGYMRHLGVDAVFDVSFGAELTVRTYLEHIKSASPSMVIAQPCPAIVTYLEIYQPELLADLAPAHSPMLHTVQMIRAFYPEYAGHKIAVLSPCTAKRREFDETGLGDYNVTYKGLDARMKSEKIDIRRFPAVEYASPLPERAVLFSSPGGLKQTVLRENAAIDPLIRKIEGPHTIYRYLEKLPEMKRRGMQPLLVDCLNCELGCNGGPGTLNQGKSPDEVEYYIEQKRRKMQEEYGRKAFGKPDVRKKINKVVDKYWKPGLYGRKYVDRSANNTTRTPNNDELTRIYRTMQKVKEEDFKNCSSCGYNTCEAMAVAIHNGLNRPDNCHYYQYEVIEQDHRRYRDVANRLHEEIRRSTGLVESIRKSIDSVNDKSHNQYASLEESSASIEEMVSSIGNASRVASERQTAVEKLIATARQGETDLRETVARIETIAKSVEDISEMIGVINSVASSTNLLSINAAIEAAHAGESGRGFSVVAAEIRNLAERTADNARTISVSLKKMIEGITEAAHKSRDTGGAVSSMIGEIIEIADSLTQLTNSMHEMSVGSGQIVEAIVNLKDISYEVKSSYGDMATAVGSVQEAIGTISQISDESVSTLKTEQNAAILPKGNLP